MPELKKKCALFLAVLLLAFATACSDPEGNSAQLYETAQFEEQQFNTEHAKQLYEEILQKYPDAAVAAKAKKRLEALKTQTQSPISGKQRTSD